MKILKRILLSLVVIFFHVSLLKADTILLSDGTYLVGKVIRWDAHHIIFKNSHGTFVIKKRHLVKLYIANNHLEDIEINKTLGDRVKDEDIIRHYTAGMSGMPAGGIDRDDVESGVRAEDYNRKVRVLCSYYHTAGLLSKVLTSGYGFSAGYSQSVSHLLPDGAALWAPLLYIELDSVFFRGDAASVDVFSLLAGPRFEFKIFDNNNGAMSFQVLSGWSYLMVRDKGYKSSGTTLPFKVTTGYEYPLGDFFAFMNLSYVYVHDRKAPIHAFGVSTGAVYKF